LPRGLSEKARACCIASQDSSHCQRGAETQARREVGLGTTGPPAPERTASDRVCHHHAAAVSCCEVMRELCNSSEYPPAPWEGRRRLPYARAREGPDALLTVDRRGPFTEELAAGATTAARWCIVLRNNKASYTWERAGTGRHLCASGEGRRGASTGTRAGEGKLTGAFCPRTRRLGTFGSHYTGVHCTSSALVLTPTRPC
jgi:hypothetical protein